MVRSGKAERLTSRYPPKRFLEVESWMLEVRRCPSRRVPGSCHLLLESPPIQRHSFGEPNPAQAMNTCTAKFTEPRSQNTKSQTVTRRSFLSTATTAAAGTVFAQALSAAERDWSGKSPVRYPDADILSLDPRFDKYKIGNTPI